MYRPLAVVKAECVHLCRVEGKTVWDEVSLKALHFLTVNLTNMLMETRHDRKPQRILCMFVFCYVQVCFISPKAAWNRYIQIKIEDTQTYNLYQNRLQLISVFIWIV